LRGAVELDRDAVLRATCVAPFGGVTAVTGRPDGGEAGRGGLHTERSLVGVERPVVTRIR